MAHANLWAPWRMAYIDALVGQEGDDAPRESGCFLCEAARTLSEDAAAGSAAARERLVLLHDGRGLLMLNRYPYTNGHLLAAPREHVGCLSDLSPRGRADLMELTELGDRLLRAAMNPQGMNIGMNLGRCAGAGLPGHLHVHLVPRWNGDTNFMQTTGGVRVIPQALEASYGMLREVLEGMG